MQCKETYAVQAISKNDMIHLFGEFMSKKYYFLHESRDEPDEELLTISTCY